MPDRYCLVCEKSTSYRNTRGSEAPRVCRHCDGEMVGTVGWPPAIEDDLKRIRHALARVLADEPGVTEPDPGTLPEGSTPEAVEAERQSRRREKIARLDKQLDQYERKWNAALEKQRRVRAAYRKKQATAGKTA